MAVPFPPEDLDDVIQVLQKQETSTYRVLDYLQGRPRPRADRRSAAGAITACSSSDDSSLVACHNSVGISTSSSSTGSGVNEDWRSKICEWSYQVIDYFDFDREIVAISLHYLDRYVSQRLVNKKTFQLVAITTLHMACKLHSPRDQQIPMEMLRSMGKGNFTDEHICAMERSILKTLGWYVHPPTALTFAKHFLLLLDPYLYSRSQARSDIMEGTKFLTELAVMDYHFVPLKPSLIGLAALMIAVEAVRDDDLSMKAKEAFAYDVYRLAHIDPTDPAIMDCRVRLSEIFFQSDAFRQDEAVDDFATPTRSTSTPTKGEIGRIKPDSPTGVDETTFVSYGPDSEISPPIDDKASRYVNEMRSPITTSRATTKTKTSARKSISEKDKKIHKAKKKMRKSILSSPLGRSSSTSGKHR